MRATFAALSVALIFTSLTAVATHAKDSSVKPPPRGELYYVSMGDSMATGSQLDPDTGVPHETNQGYTDQTYRVLRKTYPNLRHIRLGCAEGETSATLISGGPCVYTEGSQLRQALDFINRHADRVLLLTLNIGSNDVAFSGCLGIPDPAEQLTCFKQTFNKLAGNLGHALEKITSAAQGRFPIVAANLNNKYLNSWLQGPPGKAFAQLSAQLEVVVNSEVFQPLYNAFGVKTADLASAFHSQDFTTMVASDLPPPNDMLPMNVATLCRNTYACPSLDSGLPVDFHFNKEGYSVVAREFLTALRR